MIEFGTRRAHSAEAGVLGARAAYLGGCAGSSNTLAGFRYGVPPMGTAAHSWVLSFPAEVDAFRALQSVLGDATVQLVDTYDVLEGVRRAASVGRPLWGIRIDSGDFVALSRAARQILDEAGFTDARILISGDLDEYRIRDLLAAGARVDAFGVGTELAVSADAPAMGAVYKLAEVGGRPAAKRSPAKTTLPGAKQLFRFPDHDVVGLASEPCPTGAVPVLEPVLRGGELVRPHPPLAAIRERARAALDALPAPWRALEPAMPYPVHISEALQRLAGTT